jgi:hypothetical protein
METAMSRGLGKLQRYLLGLIRRHGKPLTFAEMLQRIWIESHERGVPIETRIRPSAEPSLRRALYSLTSDKILIAIGDGGRAEPHRYFIHPLSIGMMGETEEAQALKQALEADPGADAAAARDMAKLFSPSS